MFIYYLSNLRLTYTKHLGYVTSEAVFFDFTFVVLYYESEYKLTKAGNS